MIHTHNFNNFYGLKANTEMLAIGGYMDVTAKHKKLTVQQANKQKHQ